MKNRLLIIDDHPIVREGLKGFLELHSDLEVVAEADTLAAGQALVETSQPDLILLDVQLPDGNALSALPAFKRLAPSAKIIILTSFLEDAYVRDAVRLGASGYVLKHSGPKALLDYIRAALRGELPLDPSAVKVLASPADDSLSRLTPRETEVLQRVTQGLSNKQIARALGVTEKTVKTHATSIFAKLGVRDRTQAALLARDLGL